VIAGTRTAPEAGGHPLSFIQGAQRPFSLNPEQEGMEEEAGSRGSARGVFITFEGIEGTGKTTQMIRTEGALQGRGHCVMRTREPGGTRIGERIREVLLAREHGDMAPVTELFLYEACRAQLVRESIRAQLRQGGVVLCDRFSDATVAYQGFGRGLDLGLIETLNRTATDGIEPDLTLLLDCPVEQGLARVHHSLGAGTDGRHLEMDRLEIETRSFHERVRQGYLEIASGNPHRVRVVDARGDVDRVHEEILGHVVRLLQERGL